MSETARDGGKKSAITETVLECGMTLVNVPMPDRDSVSIVLIVRAGSRDETSTTAGLAHLLEHLFYRGTKKRPSSKVLSFEIEGLGADANAETDVEQVMYYITGPRARMMKFIEILADMLCHPTFRPDVFDKEVNVVLQELAGRFMNPEDWVADHMPEAEFGGGQSLSWTAIGLPGVFKKVTREDLVAYHQHLYDPRRMALVVAGGAVADPAEVAALFSDIPHGSAKRRQQAEWGKGPTVVKQVRPVHGDEEPQVTMTFALKGVSHHDPDAAAMEVLCAALGGSSSSRLFLNVRDEKGLCYAISADHESYDDIGCFEISTATRPQDASRAAYESFSELRKLAAAPLGKRELDKVLNYMEGELYRGTSNELERAVFHASQWRRGETLRTPAETMAAYRQVTAADVQRVARRLVAEIPDVRLGFSGPTDLSKELLLALSGVKPKERRTRSPQREGVR